MLGKRLCYTCAKQPAECANLVSGSHHPGLQALVANPLWVETDRPMGYRLDCSDIKRYPTLGTFRM